MMIKISELKNRDVVNVNDGRRLGTIMDLDIDLQKGVVNSIVVPSQKGFWGRLSGPKDHIISWSKIVRIGVDTILVDYPREIL
jgi:YlmC/YmxH family sporulation protein